MTHPEFRLTINLGAVRRNWQRLQDQLRPGALCAAVTKANAYGLGAAEVAPALYAQGCRQFFVATLTEGIELRQLLPVDAVILVLNGLRPGAEADCVRHRLLPVLFTLPQMERWLAAQRAAGVYLPCALKYNSGMTRLGLDAAELELLCRQESLLLALQPVLLISHLACADEPGHPMNQQQLASFRQALWRMRQVVPGIRASLANSAGIFLGDEWHFDLARPGAALYGINPCAGRTVVEPVVALQLPVVQVREVQGGERVGYGSTYTVPGPGRLAVVLGGYADGLQRTLGNCGYGIFAGIEVPLVGRVSMDSIVFDISAVPAVQIPPEGDAFIELLGPHLTVDELARRAGTIGYEVLTSLGDRYIRHYINEGAELLPPSATELTS
jgi:alanine racemase